MAVVRGQEQEAETQALFSSRKNEMMWLLIAGRVAWGACNGLRQPMLHSYWFHGKNNDLA